MLHTFIIVYFWDNSIKIFVIVKAGSKSVQVLSISCEKLVSFCSCLCYNEAMNATDNIKADLIDRAIQSFVRHRVGGVIVNTVEGEILYFDKRIVISDHALAAWQKRRPSADEEKCWEFSDAEADKYYRIETASVQEGDCVLQCHLFTDVSDYASLFKDISDYSRLIADVSDFQKGILAKMTQSYDSCLPDLVSFCDATEATLYLESDDRQKICISSFNRRMRTQTVSASEEMDSVLGSKRFDLSNGSYCFLCEETDSRRYALFLRRGKNFNEEYFRDASVYNVVRLFIENGILREKIIYESEHDKLTKLYNKGKYLDDREKSFGQPEKIIIFNFDVNNLKQVNDSQGHEAGDCIIIKAAKSIQAILSDEVKGYRVGGDEFIVVACGISAEAGEELKKVWQQTLATVNKEICGPDTTVACGSAYGEGAYKVDDLLAEADRMMYQNKKAIKAALGLPERG